MRSAFRKRPQSWNRYSYVENNPLGYIDPSGEIARSVAGFGTNPDSDESGVNQISTALSDIGVDSAATSWGQDNIEEAVDEIVEAVDTDGNGEIAAAEDAATPVSLVGHSMGGTAVLDAAGALGARGITVDYIAIIDKVGTPGEMVPENVADGDNFRQEARWPRGETVERVPGSRQPAIRDNVVQGETHGTIDNSTRVQRRIVQAIQRLEQP